MEIESNRLRTLPKMNTADYRVSSLLNDLKKQDIPTNESLTSTHKHPLLN